MEVILKKLARPDRTIIVLNAAAVALLGWAYLFYQGWAMEHMDLVTMAMPSTGAWGFADVILVFAMWAVMMVAMMVPSVISVLLIFAAIVRARHAQGRIFVPSWVFLAGYLVSWTGFSLSATLAQWGLHSLALISPMMVGTNSLLGGFLLITAGVYQWTPLKHACLRHCRSPLQFLSTCWQDGTAGAFLMGVRHGTYCLGCCWLLMAVLFAVGVMNLGWIATLSIFVLVEKMIPRGFSLAKAGGVLLVIWGGWLAFSGRA
jgi:predicted metal-binding membrane protein